MLLLLPHRPSRPARRRRSRASLRALVATAALGLDLGAAPASWAQGGPVTFSVIGDIPYSAADADRLREFVADHNAMSPSGFFVHVGDIKAQTGECPEPPYLLASDILGGLAVPTFVLPGDNEWNDCDDPDAAWILWQTHISEFEQRYCGTPPVEAQAERAENFAFLHDRVLFIGLNLVGGTVHDADEWDLRMQQDAAWVEQQLAEKRGQARAAVVFGHAERNGSRSAFFDRFDVAVLAFGRPVLFIHGDGHAWHYDRTWVVPNLSRIEIEQNDPPLEVTVTLDASTPFVFERDPWPAGTPLRNDAPCVDAGPDQIVPLGQGAPLDALVTDDGLPAAGGVAVAWSQVSGPGQAQSVIADPGSPATTAAFPEAGSYLLRIAADDGALGASDDVAIYVDSGAPSLWIRDAEVVEGDAGSTAAVFRVDLLSATGSPVEVDYRTEDAAAVAGSDHQASAGSLAFSGATTSRSIQVPVLGDEELEAFETFLVRLEDASGAVIADGSATGLIRDDDIPPPPVVTSFTPSRGPRGSLVSVRGDFGAVIAASVAGVPAEFASISSGEIELVVPATARSGPIAITSARGTAVSAGAFGVELGLSVEVLGEGSVSLDPPGGIYLDGESVTLTPVPAAGWEFLVWGAPIGGRAVPAVIQISDETSVTAAFVEEGSVVLVPQSISVAGGDDDAEEELDGGRVNLASGDLELAVDVGPQAVGLRFAGVAIPQGARILSASVQFRVDELRPGPAALRIHGQAADDAAPFRDASGDVSGRPTTSVSVAWSPPEWEKVGEAGPGQRTPDLSALVQEIVDRPGWAPGHALALVVTGTGTRAAEAYEGNPAGAARLELVALIDLAPPETPANLHWPDRSGTSIDLAWDPSTDNVGVTGYRLYRLDGPVDVVGTSYTANGLVPDTEYAFQLAALDAAGNESLPGPVLRVRTAATDREPPTTPQDLHAPVRTSTSIELAWQPATDDVGVTGYRLYRSSGSIDVTGEAHTETGLVPDRVYVFQVAALDAVGNESAPSGVLAVRTRPADREPPSAPQNLRSPARTETSIALAWDASTDDRQVVGYRVYGPSGLVDVAGTLYSATGLAPDTLYAFQVSALDAAGNESRPSAVLGVRTLRRDLAPPTTPQDLRSPIQTEASIALAWNPATDDVGVAGYRLYRGSGPIDLPGTTHIETGLAPGRSYAFQVSALDAAGKESAPSPVLVARTLAPDREAPTSPPNLRSPTQTETRIDLAWDAATDDRQVVGYRVYGPSGSVEVAGTTYSEAGLAPDTPYAFQVSALDAAGHESMPSAVAARTRPRDLGPPTTPQGLRSLMRTETSITLGWEPATDDVGVTGYRLYLASGPRDVPGTSHTVSGLAPDTAYAFQVSALDAAGKESAPSPVLVVRTRAPDGAAPSTPANLRSPAQTATRIDLAWFPATDDVGVTGYRLYVGSSVIGVPGTTYSATGLAPDTAYAFQVSALDAAGKESVPSPVLMVRTRALDSTPPTTPANLRSPAQTETSIELAWDAATDDRQVVGYRLYRSGGAIDVTGTHFTETGLVPGRTYGFQVSARDAAGNESAPSAMLTVRAGDPDVEPPTTPQNLRSPAQTETSIELAWDAATDDRQVAGYRVYGPSGSVDVAGTTYSASGLAPGTEYAFQVSALDGAGNESAPSAVLSVRTVAPDVEPPTTPQNLRSPAQTETSIALAWDASTDDRQVVGYRVDGPGGLVPVLGTTYTATGLAPGTEYAFQVSALDAAGNESAPTPVLTVSTDSQLVPVALAIRVATSDDDAEEDLATGSVTRTSSDLELVTEGAAALQAVGLRFAGVGVPQGASILSASVQFSADETGSGPIALAIHGEASDDAAPFTGVAGNVSSRPPTSASAAWSPPDWTTVGAAGAAQRTSDLSAVVQEIVNRPGWTPGHALVLVVTGTGKRTAEAYDGAPAAAPRLDIVYLGAPDRNPPSTPANLRSPRQTASQIDLAWDASSDDVGVTGYRVYGPGGVVEVAGTTWTATGLAKGTRYEFQVSALDAAGNESASSPVLAVSTTDTEVVLVAVAGGSDDAEEDLATGSVNRTSGDLELAVAVAPQAVGLRFAGVGIPQGATIVSASVQFRADEVSTGPAALAIHAEAADDATPFALTVGDVSARPATSVTIPWSPPDWTAVGAAEAAQRTPDLAALVQEVVDRPGWLPGHALVLVVTGSGTRIAESYDGLPAAAPLLRVEYRVD